jgi:hypothetical protein
LVEFTLTCETPSQTFFGDGVLVYGSLAVQKASDPMGKNGVGGPRNHLGVTIKNFLPDVAG